MKLHVSLAFEKIGSCYECFYKFVIGRVTYSSIQLIDETHAALERLNMTNASVTFQDTPTSHTRKVQVTHKNYFDKLSQRYIIMNLAGEQIEFCKKIWDSFGLPDPPDGTYYIRVYRK